MRTSPAPISADQAAADRFLARYLHTYVHHPRSKPSNGWAGRLVAVGLEGRTEREPRRERLRPTSEHEADREGSSRAGLGARVLSPPHYRRAGECHGHRGRDRHAVDTRPWWPRPRGKTRAACLLLHERMSPCRAPGHHLPDAGWGAACVRCPILRPRAFPYQRAWPGPTGSRHRPGSPLLIQTFPVHA